MAVDAIDRPTLDHLLETLDGDTEFLHDLMDTYFSDSAELFSQLKGAAARGDAPEFQRAAHSLKSNSASMGALRLSGMAKHMEEMGRTSQLEGAERHIAEAAAEYERAKATLQAIRAGA